MAREIYFLLKSICYPRLTCVKQENVLAPLPFLINILCSFFRKTVKNCSGGIVPDKLRELESERKLKYNIG
jgi:hypothetical protein